MLPTHLERRKAPDFEVVNNFSCLLSGFSVSMLQNFHMTPKRGHIAGYNQFSLVHIRLFGLTPEVFLQLQGQYKLLWNVKLDGWRAVQ